MPVSEYRPGVEEVGAILRARTVDTSGAETGTFTPLTRPTDEQVAHLIEGALRTVSGLAGEDLPAGVREQAMNVVALRTALMIELTYFPEQVPTGRSPYDRLKELFDEELKALIQAAQQAGGGDEAGSVDDTKVPVFGFPPDAGGLIGWGTIW